MLLFFKSCIWLTAYIEKRTAFNHVCLETLPWKNKCRLLHLFTTKNAKNSRTKVICPCPQKTYANDLILLLLWIISETKKKVHQLCLYFGFLSLAKECCQKKIVQKRKKMMIINEKSTKVQTFIEKISVGNLPFNDPKSQWNSQFKTTFRTISIKLCSELLLVMFTVPYVLWTLVGNRIIFTWANCLL